MTSGKTKDQTPIEMVPPGTSAYRGSAELGERCAPFGLLVVGLNRYQVSHNGEEIANYPLAGADGQEWAENQMIGSIGSISILETGVGAAHLATDILPNDLDSYRNSPPRFPKDSNES